MKGLVLCGGGSTRMGSDKGLLKVEEETWAELAARKLTALHLPVFISINALQAATYAQVFFEEQLLIDDPSFTDKAPLFGLLSAHVKFPGDDWFVLACDIKDMSTALMQRLQTEYENQSHEAYLFRTGNKPQPLCGIYTAAGLHKIFALYQQQNLQRYSMMHVLETLSTTYLEVKDEDLSCFNNFNSPPEL